MFADAYISSLGYLWLAICIYEHKLNFILTPGFVWLICLDLIRSLVKVKRSKEYCFARFVSNLQIYIGLIYQFGGGCFGKLKQTINQAHQISSFAFLYSCLFYFVRSFVFFLFNFQLVRFILFFCSVLITSFYFVLRVDYRRAAYSLFFEKYHIWYRISCFCDYYDYLLIAVFMKTGYTNYGVPIGNNEVHSVVPVVLIPAQLAAVAVVTWLMTAEENEP